MASVSEIAQGAESGHHCRTCTCSRDGSPTSETDQSLEDTIEDMDREIAQMRDALDVLKRRRNARLTITRIPPELLSEIFLYVRDTSILPVSKHWRTVPWICITHIFAQWRSIALADPRLWTVVNLRFPDLVSHFSDYFADMPLHVLLSRPGLYSTLDGHVNLDHVPACILANPIVALDVYAHNDEAMGVMGDAVPHAADTLLSLEIDMAPDWDLLSSPEDTPIPNLQSLSLSSFEALPGCALYASCTGSLRELKLRSSSSSEWSPKYIESFSLLERLWLSYDSAVFCAADTISLPALAELHIKDTVEVCRDALRTFRLPAGCHVLVASQLSHRSTGGEPLREIIALMSAAHPNHARVYIADDFFELRYAGAQDVHYALKHTYGADRINYGVATLAAILPSSTTELSVVCDDKLSHGKLQELAACNALQSLSICGPFLIDSLSRSRRRKNTKLLPNLSLIRVCDCNAVTEQTMLHAWQFRKGLDVRASRVELCRRTYKCVEWGERERGAVYNTMP